MNIEKFRSLPPRQRALVAVAVLLDGREAPAYLDNDESNGSLLREAASELAACTPELRMPLVGTLLRVSMKEKR